jgi:outer membrane protein TolC
VWNVSARQQDSLTGSWTIALAVLWVLVLAPATAPCQDPAVRPAEGQAGPGELLTLEQAIALATSENRYMKNATLDVERAEDQLAATRTHLLPQLNVTAMEIGTVTPLDFKINKGALGTFPSTGPIPANDTKITTNPRFSTFVFASAAQPLTQLYRIGEGIQAQELSRDVASEQVRQQRHTVVNNVKRGYFAVLQTQSALDAAEEYIAATRELERVVGQQVQQQKALKSDLMEVRTQLANAEYNTLTLHNQLMSQKEQLNVILGRDIGIEFSVAPVSMPSSAEADLAKSTDVALKQRPDVKGARLRVQQAEHDHTAKKAEYIPDLNVVATYIHQDATTFLPQNVGFVGLQLNWEPFDWGRKKRESAEKARVIAQAANSVREAEAQTMAEVNSQYRRLQESYSLLQVNQMARETAREKLRIMTNRYAQKAALLQEVLQAHASLANANSQYSRALLAFWTAKADFEKAIGED